MLYIVLQNWNTSCTIPARSTGACGSNADSTAFQRKCCTPQTSEALATGKADCMCIRTSGGARARSSAREGRAGEAAAGGGAERARQAGGGPPDVGSPARGQAGGQAARLAVQADAARQQRVLAGAQALVGSRALHRPCRV